MTKVIMLVGLPGVDKSIWAEQYIKNNDKTIHVSSDIIRERLFPNGYEENSNDLVFRRIHDDIKQYINNGFNVVYDATNLSRKKRRHFIKHVVRGVRVDCVLFHEPIETILERNETRAERHLPTDVIIKYLRGFNIPLLSEGFYKMTYVGETDQHEIVELYSQLMDYDQDNSYHKLTLGNHILKVHENVIELMNKYAKYLGSDIHELRQHVQNFNGLQTAALLHDIGKPIAREQMTNYSRYIGHENISGYMALPYINPKSKLGDLAHTLISYHMRAHETSEKAHKKIINEIGKDKYELLMLFNKCDQNAKE